MKDRREKLVLVSTSSCTNNLEEKVGNKEVRDNK